MGNRRAGGRMNIVRGWFGSRRINSQEYIRYDSSEITCELT